MWTLAFWYHDDSRTDARLGRVLINAQIAAFYGPFTSVVQKIALTAMFDQAALFKLEVTPVRPPNGPRGLPANP
jgi:hypothetical protein